MKIIFESAIEKIGRILARQYNIDIRFEGNSAYTDGKQIVLPYFENMDAEMKADLNGYLDHEVAHCKFTKFDEINLVISRFHKELLNASEDVRIEREMIAEYPGTQFNLGPLNQKLRTQMEAKWSEIPALIRIIIGITDIQLGRVAKIDKDTERYIDVVQDAAIELRKCKNTTEVREVTEKIVRLIEKEREKEREEKGKNEKDKAGDETKENPDSSESESSSDKDDKSKADKKSKTSKGKGKNASDAKGSDSDDSDKTSDVDQMLSERPDSSGSEFDEHIHDVHGMINKEIEKHLKESPKRRESHDPSAPVWADDSSVSIPVTTRFDKVTDHSNGGNAINYAKDKREVMPLIAPIKAQLERLLKVKENAKWINDREQGTINARSLCNLASDKNYRRVFKEYTRTDTSNVAVQILVDLSGSMAGRISTAKKTVIAMAEALKDLQITFEVTGFYSESNHHVYQYARSIEDKSDTRRFNRKSESLSLHIFKSFDAHSLTGIDKMHVGSQNPDGECVAWAAKRLSERKEKRKILLVMSDGEPATGEGSRAILCSDLKRRVTQLKKIGVECVGFGIETDSVRHYYPDYIIIKNVRELPKQVMGKLSKIIGK